MILLAAMFCFSTLVAVSQEGKEKKGDKEGGKEGFKGKFEGKDKEKGGFGMRGPGGLLPPFMRQQLGLTDEQVKKIDDIEKKARDSMMEVLTKDQKAKMEEFFRFSKEGDRPPFGKEGKEGDRKKEGGEKGKEGDRKKEGGEKGKEGDRKKEGGEKGKEGDRKKEVERKEGDRKKEGDKE
jgi:hypothetical protein